MGTNKTPEYLRGFLLPNDISINNVWTAQSNFTQQNASAGDPVPQQSTKIRLLSTGQQSDNGDIQIVTRAAGNATYGARFTIRNNISSTTEEYGRDAMNAISAFKIKNVGSLSTTYTKLYSYVTKDNTLLVAYQHVSGLTTTLKILRIQQNLAESTINLYTLPTSFVTAMGLQSAITQLEDESIIVSHLYEDDGQTNIRVLRSTDDGATFTVVSRTALDNAITVGTATGAGVNTFKIINVQMCSIEGSVLLIIETEINNTSVTKRNQIFQYVSIDNAATFQKITTDTNAQSNSFRSLQLKERLGRYVISYIAQTGIMHYMELPNPYSNIHLLRTANAYVTIRSVPTAAAGTNDYMTSGDSSMLITPDGDIYVYAYSGGSNNFIVTQYSSDGINFLYTNGDETVQQSTLFNADDTLTVLSNLTCVYWLGRGLIISNCTASSTIDSSIIFSYLGGYANINLPKSFEAAAEQDWVRTGYVRSYLPIDLPSDISGFTVLGTGNDALTSGYLRITSSPGHPSSRFYRFTTPTTLTNSEYVSKGLFIRCNLIAVASGGTTANQRGFTAAYDDGSNRYKVEVYITTTSIKIRDVIASADIATITHDNTQGVDIIFAMANNKISAWYNTTTYTELRQYTNICNNATIANSTSSAAGQTVEFGHLTYTSGTVTTDWNEFHVSTLSATGLQLANGFSSPNDLAAVAYPPLGKFTYVFDNVSISTTDGSTYEGDEFNIKPQFEYPIDNIFYDISPTPRIQYRSQSVTSGSVAQQQIAIKLNPDTSTQIIEAQPNDLIGFSFSGVNWRLGEIQYHNGTTWVSLCNIVNQIRCSCMVTGRSVRGVSGLSTPYFTFNELKDWTAYFVVGSDQEVHKITSNTEGIFGGTGTSTKQSTVQFLTNPPQGAGTVYFIPPMFTILQSMNGIQSAAFKIIIDSQKTYENDIRIGEFIQGFVLVPGRQYASGRRILIESGTEESTTLDGIRYTKQERPNTKIINVAWTDGIDITQLQGTTPDVDYWLSSNQTGAQPVAVNNDAPDLMLGMMSYLNGQQKHFVYLPNINKSTSALEDTRTLTRQTEQTLVTLDSDIQIEHVIGDELQNEVFRIAQISMKQVT